MRKITKTLLRKSSTAFLLSLELFNKPTIDYRVEAFSFFFTNAWELLLKAKIYEDSKGNKKSIFIENGNKTIGLEKCLNLVFTDNTDPVKKNIEYVASIRNETAHLVINFIDPYVSRVYQSGVLNYINHLEIWFGCNLNDSLSPGLISLVTDSSLPDIESLRSKFNKQEFGLIYKLIEQYQELERLGIKGALSIEHKIAIVSNVDNADYVVSLGNDENVRALIVEKTRDIDVTHPFNMTNALAEVNERIQNLPRPINNYDFLAYCFVRNVKPDQKDDYVWSTKYSGARQYAQTFIDEFIRDIKSDFDNLDRWRSQLKQHRRNTRKKSK